MLNITDIRVKFVRKESNLKALVSITIADCFVVHDLKVLQGDSGLFVGMPSKRFIDQTGKDTHRDIAHALNTPTREYIKETVLAAYQEALKNNTEE